MFLVNKTNYSSKISHTSLKLFETTACTSFRSSSIHNLAIGNASQYNQRTATQTTSSLDN